MAGAVGLRAAMRGLNSGASRPGAGWATDADGALDAAGDPGAPVMAFLPNAQGLPWVDGLEDFPAAGTGMLQSGAVSYPDESVGALPIVGAYEGAFRTRGPVVAFGHEPSGGPYGDQALGRIMHFRNPGPSRYSSSGVQDGNGYADELAAAIANNGRGTVTEAEYTTNLLLFKGR